MLPDHISRKINWDTIPKVQSGRGLIGYRGLSRYQRGNGLGSIFRTLFRISKPLGKKVLQNVAKEGLDTVSLISQDISKGKNVKQSIKSRAKAGGKNLARKALKRTQERILPKLQGYTQLDNEDDDEEDAKKKKNQKGAGRIGYKRVPRRRGRNVYKKGGRKRKPPKPKDFFEQIRV